MDKKLIGLVLIFVLVFSLFIGALVFENPVRIRALENRVTTKCSVFVYPILEALQADGKSKFTLTISANDKNQFIVPNKVARVQTTLGQLDKAESSTGDAGNAQFFLTSTIPGPAKITAIVQGVACDPQAGVTVIFK